MNKIFKTALLLASFTIGLIATQAFAGPYDNQATSMFFTAPANTTPGYPLVQLSGTTMGFSGVIGGNGLAFPQATVVAAATPAAVVSMLSSVPTVAVNAGVFLPANPTPGQMAFISNQGGNTINVYPQANAAGTPAAINAIAAGTPAALATVKTLICWAQGTAGTQWICTWGQGS